MGKKNKNALNALNEDEAMSAIMAAYSKLSEMERNEIDYLVYLVEKGVKARNPNAMFGPRSALELIAKLGAFLVNKKIMI